MGEQRAGELLAVQPFADAQGPRDRLQARLVRHGLVEGANVDDDGDRSRLAAEPFQDGQPFGGDLRVRDGPLDGRRLRVG